MADMVLVRTASGVDMVHDLPLPEGLAGRVAKGEETVLGPCDADGNLLTVEPEAQPVPAPAKKAAPAKAAAAPSKE